MKKQGKVTRWDAARAFGFIRSADTPADIFFHIKDFRGAALPQEGMAVTFEEIQVGGKGPRAMSVQPSADARPNPGEARSPQSQRRRAPARAASKSSIPAAVLMLGWAALLAWASGTGRLPVMTLPLAGLLNLLTFFVYWVDKHAAQTGQWRISENTLHGFGLLGGWPGAWCAQQMLRHKSSKPPFRAAYWATVVLHCALLVGLLFSAQLQELLLNK